MNERPTCPKCGRPAQKNGFGRTGKQEWACMRVDCKYGNITPNKKEPRMSDNGDGSTLGLSESQLRAKHDMAYIVKQAVAQLKKGVYLSDSEFIQKSGLKASAGYRQVLDHPDFDQYKGRAGGKIYWSHPESIKKMINDGVLN
jgi:hypothetical protein